MVSEKSDAIKQIEMDFRQNLSRTGRLLGLIMVLLLFTNVSCWAQPDIRLGICTGIDNGDILLENGYDFIEETVGKFLMPLNSDEEFELVLRKLESSALKVEACNSFIPGKLKSVGENAVHQEIAEYAETAFRRAEMAGMEIIVFGSGGSRNIPDGFSYDEARNQFIALGKMLGPLAGQHNVTIVLEPLNTKECNFINSVSEAGEIVKEIDHPNFLLLADIYHMKMEDEGPENILKYGSLLRHVHIAEERDRAAPGTYNEDFIPYFDALKKVGYNGRLSIECRWEDMKEQAGIAKEVIESQLTQNQ
jgi:sugar phosphate isomerase/epimerase